MFVHHATWGFGRGRKRTAGEVALAVECCWKCGVVERAVLTVLDLLQGGVMRCGSGEVRFSVHVHAVTGG